MIEKIKMRQLIKNKRAFFGKEASGRKMNKRAEDILSPEVVKMVIAILCLIALLYLAYSMYSMFFKKTGIEQAKQSLEQLVTKINNMKEGQKDKYLIQNPKDWYLIVFKIGETMPKSCSGTKNCICICQKQDYTGCDNNGVCKELDLDAEMSYNCFTSTAVGLDYVHRCFKIEIKEILLEKKSGILFIGPEGSYSVGDKFFSVLSIVDTESGNSVEDLIFQSTLGYNEKLRGKIIKLIKNYLAQNLSEVSDWNLEIDLNGQIVSAFTEATPIDPSSGVAFVPTFANNVQKTITKDGKQYLFKFNFNTKSQ